MSVRPGADFRGFNQLIGNEYNTLESGVAIQMRKEQAMAAQRYERDAMMRQYQSMMLQMIPSDGSYAENINKAGAVFIVQNEIEKEKKLSMMPFHEQLQSEVSEWCGGILGK